MAVSIDSAHPSLKEVEAAWSEEIKRRLAEIDAGTVELIPWEEVRAELFAQTEWLFSKKRQSVHPFKK